MNKILEAKEVIHKYIVQLSTNKKYCLPSERSLAEKFGYSRGTIGKALGVLAAEGTVLRKHGSGTFISDKIRKRTLTVAVVMRNAYDYTDVHFRQIVESISRHVEKNNIYLQIFDRVANLFENNPNDNSLIQAINSGIIDGVLVVSRMPLQIICKLNSLSPTVIINNLLGIGSEIPCFSCNHFRVGFLAGKYLLANGHRKLAYITDTLSHPEAELQLCGFKSALEMRGVELTEADILETKQDYNIFNKRVKVFYNKSVHTAYFVRHAIFALKIITVLQKMSLKVPEDISIIACGNYKNILRSYIDLTTVDNQTYQMCRMGLECLLNIIKNNNNPEGGLKLLTPQIIENNSVINVDH